MLKEEILSAIKELNSNRISIENITKILTNYCLEFNKPIDKINKFISTLLSMGIIIVLPYYKEAIEYYEKKFNIVRLIDKNNNVIKIF